MDPPYRFRAPQPPAALRQSSPEAPGQRSSRRTSVSQAKPASLRALRRHPGPTWWSDAKLGIFIHWTPAAVAGFAPTGGNAAAAVTASMPHPIAESPYSEWYQNSLRFPDSSVARHHRATYGNRPYEAFADDFQAGL